MHDLRSPGIAYVLLTLAVLFWSGNWIAGKMLADLFPPAALTFWRWVTALLLVSPVVVPKLWASRALLAKEWKSIAMLGLLGGGLHNVLQYWGLRYTAAINGPILNSLTSIFIIVLASFFLHDPFPRRAAVGATISFIGALVVITRLDVQLLLDMNFNRGDLLIVLSLVMLAAYTVGLRKRPTGLDSLSFLACFALVGLVPVGVAYAIEYDAGARIVINAKSLAGLAYVAVFPALLAYHFWNLGVATIGAPRAGTFMYLNPFFGSVLGVAILGESFGAHHAAGIVLILSGVILAQKTKASDGALRWG